MNMVLEDKIQVHSIINEGTVLGVPCLLSVESVESVDEYLQPTYPSVPYQGSLSKATNFHSKSQTLKLKFKNKPQYPNGEVIRGRT